MMGGMRRGHAIGVGGFTLAACTELVLDAATPANIVGLSGAVFALALMRRPLAAASVAAAALSVAVLDGSASIVAFAAVAVTVVGAAWRVPLLPKIAATVLGVLSCLVIVALDEEVSVGDGLQPIALLVSAAVGSSLLQRDLRRTRQIATMRLEQRISAARADLARDVHDVTSHALMAVLAQLRVGSHRLATADRDSAELGLQRAEVVVKDAIVDLRSLTMVIAGGDERVTERVPVRDVYSQFTRACTRFPVATLEHDNADGMLDPPVATTAIRVVQQCLANAAAHAPGLPVSITAGVDGQHLEIVARNPVASGSEPRLGPGLGMSIMSKRVHDVGGEIDIDARHEDFCVRCRLPIGGSV